jgi:hypothetical protein
MDDNIYMTNNNEGKEMVIKSKTIQVTETRTRKISMWQDKDSPWGMMYCIGYIHDRLGIMMVYRRGQKKYIEKMWKTYN